MQGSPEQRRFWADLAAIREVAAKQMEVMRANREIGASLEAEVTLYLDAKLKSELEPYADELRFYFIVSELTLDDDGHAPPEAALVDPLKENGRIASVSVRKSGNTKCIRCWHYRPDVGSNPAHPEICGRCVTNIEGPGETRRWF
jgi:isoleucyl-tRNA synthetase